MKPSVANRIRERLRGFAEALENQEAITHRFTCRKIVLNLEPTAYDAQMVKETRRLLGVSQAVFARFFGVSVKTVQAWEHGLNPPRDVACRFMDEIRNNPRYWVRRLKQLIVAK